MTTDQMDGLYTPKDIAEKHTVFIQCRKCSKWTCTDSRTKDCTCTECGSDDFDPTSTISKRTFNPNNKRKAK